MLYQRRQTIGWISAVQICLFFSAATAAAATSISQFGITWKFDRDYQTGQFANGDYWVVGPVQIVQITPHDSDPSDGVDMHGSMVNPAVSSGRQGFDSRIRDNQYVERENVARTIPLVLERGASLVSSESNVATATGDNPQMRTVAILTVLDQPAPVGSFRPPPVGVDKSLRWNISQLDYSRLGKYKRTTTAAAPNTFEKSFERPWLELNTRWTGRYLRAAENQPTYGRDIAYLVGDALLSLQADYSDDEKRALLVRAVQYGLDIYGSARAGGVWSNDGGQNHGRKLPMLMAGWLLHDPDILAYADARQRLIFQEDQQCWFVTKEDVGRPLYQDDGRYREEYIAQDIGIPEWGEKHTGQPQRDGRNWSIAYRDLVGSSVLGHALAAKLMKVEAVWGWPAFFSYMDRFWSLEKNNVANTNVDIHKNVASMWTTYIDVPAAPKNLRVQ